MSAHARIRDLLPLYALGALAGTDECDVVCEHLATGCSECAAELAANAAVASRLPEALPPMAPRASSRDALAKKLAATPRPAENVVSLEEARRERAPARGRWLWTAVASASAAAFLVAAVNLREQLRWERNRHFDDAKEIANLHAELARLDRRLEADESLLAALSSGDATVLSLAPASADQTGTGHLIWNRKDRTWTLLASGMKPLERDQVYELWLVENGQEARSALRFEPGPAGLVRQTVKLPPDMDRFDVAAVTLEPRIGDDPKPSGVYVITGKTG